STAHYYSSFFFSSSRYPRHLHSFPTRRSSDLYPLLMFVDRPTDSILVISRSDLLANANSSGISTALISTSDALSYASYSTQLQGDRKSTRLNSSHVAISYAVFCLKKKKKYSIV